MSVHTLKTARLRRLRSTTSLPTITLGLVLLSAPEKATAQIVPVCDRTPEVRDAIVEKIPGVSDCGEVTEAHLAVITGFLDLEGPHLIWGFRVGRPNPIPELKAGDFSGLSSLEGLQLQHNDLTTLPPGLFHGLSSLKTLALRGNRLTLPAGIFSGLTVLETLTLSLHYNDPIPLVDLFSGITSLQSLTLYVSDRSTLPDDLFSGLSTLESLKLRFNGLTTLPAGVFAELLSLESLNLAFNRLTKLPAGTFSGLSSLKRLDLSDNRLTTLPAGIFTELSSLESLDLIDNRLTTLPAGIFAGPSSLERLHLRQNRLTTLPAGIFAGLSSLKWLDLGSNDLTPLPTGVFSELSSLEWLFLVGNGLTTLPAGIFAELSSLEGVYLGGNNLTTLPAGVFSGLSLLEWLGLSDNDLTTLPTGTFSGLSTLEGLYLGGNDLTTLPAGVFSGLSSLQTLGLRNNELTMLPAGIFAGLSSLKRLDLDRNGLTTLPAGAFSGLSSLQTLDLSSNSLATLPAGVFSGLSSLQTLGLRNNELTTLPAGVFSGLSSLQTLNLTLNRLTTLPDGIFAGLSSLESLELIANRLTTLPDGIFAGLPSLKRLFLSQNRRLLTTLISLEFAREGRFRARAQTGALFDIVLPITVVNGVIDGGSSQITIPRGSVESATFTVSRDPGTASAVFVDIGEMPEMPDSIYTDLTLVKSPNLPLTVLEAPSLHFAHFANGGSITSELVLVNVGAEPIRPVISFLDHGGNLLPGGWLVELREDLEVQEDGSLRVRTSIEPLGERTISTHPRRTIVSGSVRVESDGPLGGVLRYVNPDIGVAGVGASPRVRDAIFPARKQEGGIRSAVAVRNRGAEWMRVRCQLMQAGAVLEETEISLKGDGQAAWFLDELFTETDTSDFLGSVRCTAPRGKLFTGVAVEMDAGNRIFTTLPMVPVEPAPAGGEDGTLDFAHFGNGSSIRSELVLVNVGAEPMLPAVYFYDQDGSIIAAESIVDVVEDLEVRDDGALSVRTEMVALSELTISTHGRGELILGSVRVISDGPIGGVLRFDVPSVGVAGVGASPPVTSAMFPARRQENGINTGAAVRNLESEAMTLTCALMQNGRMLAETAIDLKAGGQVARFIDELFKEADTFDFAGSVHCTAPPGGSFTGVALEMDADNRIFTTLPMVPVLR